MNLKYNMKSYELNCLLNPNLNITQIKEFTQGITSSFKEKIKEENLTKINLSYPIKKEGQAFLYSINFESSPQKINDLQEKLKSENKVLRFQILSKKERKLPSKKIRMAKKTIPSRLLQKAKGILPKKPLSFLTKKKLPKKVEIEDIKKKLDEILGE